MFFSFTLYILFGLLYPFSIWTFTSVLYLDFVFKFFQFFIFIYFQSRSHFGFFPNFYIFYFTRFSFNFQFQELYQLAQTVIGAHLMPTVMMANIEAKLLLHNSVLMPMPPRLITLLYKNAKGQLNSLEKYGKKIFNY